MNGPRVWMVVKRSGGHGGLQHQARRVSLRMLSNGTPVRLVTHRPPDRDAPSGWAMQMPSDRLPGRNQWEFASRLYGHLCRSHGEYDLIHVHGLGLETFAAMAAARRVGKPIVVKPSTAGPGTKLGLYSRIGSPARRLWRGVDAWVSISALIREDLVKMGVEPRRIADIPNGVDTEEFRPLDAEGRRSVRARQRLDADDLVISTVARLSPHKRVDAVIRAFGELQPECPQLRLQIIGTGQMRHELESLAAQVPGRERIKFCDKARPDQIARKMQASDAFALVSRWEGLSNALLEAMACGVPPVVTDVSGMTDVVRDGESGFVVPVDDEPAITEALGRLLGDAGLRDQMGKTAAGVVRERFSLDTTVDGLLELYGRCLE